MKTVCSIFYATALGTIFLGSAIPSKADSSASSPMPSDAKEYTYKTVAGRDLKLDVYAPTNLDVSHPVPVIIAFHGGGWDHGDKRGFFGSVGHHFAQRGLVTVSVEYRFIDPLINKNHLEMGDAKSVCVEDGKSAIRWVRSHAGELGIDPSRVILAGDSAGTEICTVAALNTDINDPQDDISVPTSGMAFLLFNPAFYLPLNPSYYHEDPKLEPYGYISASMPPLIMFSGSKDGYKKAADKFLADCKAAGANAEIWVAPDQPHAFTGQANWAQATIIKADAFLVSLGILSGTPQPSPSDAILLSPEQYAASASPPQAAMPPSPQELIAAVVPATAAPQGAPATVSSSSSHIENLPESFYARPGLEQMPRIDYASLPMVNVRDLGAKGNGVDDDRAAFDRALDGVVAKGGGIIFVPKGIYAFHKPDGAKVTAYWNVSRDNLKNVHFVGEGEESVIRFYSNNQDAVCYGWDFGSVENVTLRDLSLTCFPYFNSRGVGFARGMYDLQFGDYKEDAKVDLGVQLINVTFDQSIIGALFRRGCEKGWVVDCKVRNTSADGIHFDTAQQMTAAYNLIEYTGDDTLACISVAEMKKPAVDDAFLYNVSIASQCRGVALGGARTRVIGNWIEQSQLPAILLHAHGHKPVDGYPVEDALVQDNTLVRGNLKGNLESYPAALLGEFNISNAKIDSNYVYGCVGDGIGFHHYPTEHYVTGIKVDDPERVSIEKNVVEGNLGFGFDILPHVTISGLILNGNRFDHNAGGGVLFQGNATGADFSGNQVDVAPEIRGGKISYANETTDNTSDSFGPVHGFQQDQGDESYRDVYQEIRTHSEDAAPLDPPAFDLQGLPVLNVRDFGAVGDGMADDTAAFQRAVAAVPAEGGVLSIPAGKYRLHPVAGQDTFPFTRIRHHLLIADRKNFHLKGEPNQTELVFDDPDAQGIRFVHDEACSIQGLSLRLAQQPVVRHDRSLLDISGCTRIRVENLEAADSGGPGIQIDSSREVIVTNCSSRNAGTHGISIVSSSQTRVEGCSVVGSRDCGIRLDQVGSVTLQPEFVTFQGNHIDGVKEGFGIALCAGKHVTVTNNQIENCYQAGVALYQEESFLIHPDDLQISSNKISHCNQGPLAYTTGSISLFGLGAGTIQIQNNQISDSDHGGIGVVHTGKIDQLTIDGNHFENIALGPVIIDDVARAKIDHLTSN